MADVGFVRFDPPPPDEEPRAMLPHCERFGRTGACAGKAIGHPPSEAGAGAR